MIKVGITGSLSSGKTTACKIISVKRGPLFNADHVVEKLYTQIKIKKLIAKKLRIKLKNNFKKEIKANIFIKKDSLKKIQKIIHPLVRKKMKNFSKKNKGRKFLFFEIPLLIESGLMRRFDVIIFIKSSYKLRLKRFISKGGDKKLFILLNSKQFKDKKKSKLCDHIVVNNGSLTVLKKKLFNIIKKYE